MTVKVSGFSNLGEFITGNIDFFTITTLVPCDATGISKPLEILKKDLGINQINDINTVGGIKIFGIQYNNDNEYNDAFNKQNNLDTFIKLVEQRAQAIMLNVVDEGNFINVSTAIPSGGHSSDFGSTYSGNSGNVYTIKFSTEHEGAWDENTFANELNGREILDLSSPVITDPNIFDTASSSLMNTIILKNQFL